MATEDAAAEGHHRLPGVLRPSRVRPRFHYELLVCGLRGHALIGTDAAELRPRDAIVAREIDGIRWYRCLRCDAWLPLRGRPLRDRIVLRVIAVDRAIHFLVLAALAGAIFFLAADRAELRSVVYRVLAGIQGTVVERAQAPRSGIFHDVERLLALNSGTLRLVGAAVLALGIVELVEAVGLWYQRRWAEYLTLLVTAAFLPLEVYELARTVSPFKVIALVINVAIVVYLLYAKRLFGIRGGTAAEDAVRERDVGWGSLERSSPEAVG